MLPPRGIRADLLTALCLDIPHLKTALETSSPQIVERSK